ncbi:ABC-2 type transport system ATP-binding protein [Streptacidiphilus sp. MAP12-33]|uniref:ABC transporter ATP-binding protein n=1 Tax=Streptacidiphilus sp. MAP12-33 TaxID=3156266 RepID=UPI0035115E31
METAIALDRATKRFGAVTAVDGLSLEIGRGTTVALLGANGAGKSTTVAMAMGLAAPDTGSVTVAGRPPRQAVVEGRIAAMLQDSGLMPGVTAAELVGLARRMYPAPLRVEEALELAGLRGLARRRVDRMSGGQAQRLKFALVAVAGADTMLLDEPTRALDVQGRREFWSAMRDSAAAGRTIVFATHYLDEVEENAERVVVMAHGRVVADGSPARIREAGGRAVVRFRVPAEQPLPPLPGEVARDRGWATVRAASSDEVVRRLVASGTDWSDLRISPPSLDESFLALTGSASGGDGAAHDGLAGAAERATGTGPDETVPDETGPDGASTATGRVGGRATDQEVQVR